MPIRHLLASAILVSLSAALLGTGSSQDQTIPVEKLELHNVAAQSSTYQGVTSIEIKDSAKQDQNDAEKLAIVRGTSLQDGTIDISLNGRHPS